MKKFEANGNEITIREATKKDAQSMIEYINIIASESDFLTFGPGEFHITFIEPDMMSFKNLVKSENILLQNLVNSLALQKQMMDCMVNMGMVYDGTG